MRSNNGREYMVPSMPAKRMVDEPKNCLAVSCACSLLKSEMMKSDSKRSCIVRRDWKRFSYSVICPEAPSWSRSLVRLIVLLNGDESKQSTLDEEL